MPKGIVKNISFKRIKTKTLKAIKKENLHFVDDAAIHSGLSRGKFYADKYNKDQDIIDALDQNRIETKVKLRKNWLESENATVQIALYKLIGSDKEVEILINSNHNVRINQDDINKQFEELAKVMDAVNEPDSDRPDNTGTT